MFGAATAHKVVYHLRLVRACWMLLLVLAYSAVLRPIELDEFQANMVDYCA